VLELNGVSVSYGAIRAVRDVTLRVEKGETVALIGANGAGKTTILQTVSGLLRPSAGQIFLKGKAIGGRAAHEIVAMGLSHVPEGRQVFAGMSIYENLRLGAYFITDKDVIRSRMERVFKLFPVLVQRQKQVAGTLSGGEQQMLAIGRGLMADPVVLLLDEPSLGLSPLMTQAVFDVIADLKAQGITMLLVEQNACEALEISHRAYILESGQVTMTGDSASLTDNPHVKAAYLGR